MSEVTRDKLIFTFGLGESACDPARIEILGGKGASLAAMSRAGFPVPPGFTISAACCDERHRDKCFLVADAASIRADAGSVGHDGYRCAEPMSVQKYEGQWPDGLEEQVREALAWLERTTDRTFGCGPRPLFVAVRSGAAVSMPGMMDTILNCGSDPAIEPWEALRQAINLVFASWHSDRARSYRQHHDVRHVVGTAVTVQAMFPSDRSGVLFTANPNDPASGEMILEASWGLGEAVVSGAVTPDIYILDAASLATKRVVPGSRPGNEPALSAEQVREIAELGRRVENHFQVPSDIEWGIADGRVALLQTRKIRGLEIIEDVERGRLDEVQRLRGLAGSDHAVWVIHNLSETLPAPTPLTWDIARWFMSAAGGYGQMYRLLGHRPQERERGAGFLELIAGRVYVDPRRAAEFHFGRLPFEYDIEEVLRDRTALDRPPTRFNLDRADSLFFFRLPGMLFGMIRSARQMRAMGLTARERFEQVAVPKLEAYLAATQRKTLCDLSTTDLLSELQRRRDVVLGEFAGESLVPGFFGGLAHERLRHLLTQLLGPDEGEQLAGQLTTGLEGDVTVEQNVALSEVAAGRQSREAFLQRFGHRAVNEMELSQPRWREDLDYVDRMIGRLRTGAAMSVVADAASVGADAASIHNDQSSPHERHLVQTESRRRAEAALPTILAQAGGASLRERVEHEMRQAQALLPFREVGKFHLMRGYETVREALVELGRRWELGRDVFFLRYDELSRFERERSLAEERLAQRKLRWRSAQKLSLPDVIDSRQLKEFGRRRPVVISGDHSQWECRPIASGLARGTARVVFDPREVTDLGPDAILVCPSTDPGWTPLFVNARGLIVERGGVLSHGAIVAREFGIPAVVLEAATERIADGSQIELDANHGVVTLRTSSTPVTSVPPAFRGATNLPEAR